MTDIERIIDRLRLIRTQLKITARQLAMAIGLPRDKVSRLENGDAIFTVSQFVVILNYLNEKCVEENISPYTPNEILMEVDFVIHNKRGTDTAPDIGNIPKRRE